MGNSSSAFLKWVEPTPPTDASYSQWDIAYDTALRYVEHLFPIQMRILYTDVQLCLLDGKNPIRLVPYEKDLTKVHVINACVIFKRRYGMFPWECRLDH